MALQLYVQPRGGELIGQGIMQAAEGISLGIEKYYQRKQENENMERAASFFSRAAQSDPELAKMLGVQDPKDTAALKAGIKGLGGPQKFMEMAGLYQQMQQQKMQQQAMAQRQAEIDRKDGSQKALSVALSRTNGDIQRAIPLALQMGADPGEVKEMAQAYGEGQGGAAPGPIGSVIKLPNGKEAIVTSRNSIQVSDNKQQVVGQVADEGGNFLGYTIFDPATGSLAIQSPGDKGDGKTGGVKPVTPTALSRDMVTPETLKKFEDEVNEAEVAMARLGEYWRNVGGLSRGAELLADQFTGSLKSFLGVDGLSDKELKAKVAKGQLRGLVGRFRVDTMGPGPMTQQDFDNMLDSVGGDVGALLNPEVVKKQLDRLHRDRYKRYVTAIKYYNTSVKRGGYEGDHDIRQPIFGKELLDGAAPQSQAAESKTPSGPRIISVEPVK